MADLESAHLRRDWRLHFFPMWGGQALSLIGSRVVQFALVWWLARESGSATVLASAALVALVPEIVLAPLAGAYVDRWDRRLIMVLSDGLVALVAWGLAYLFWVEAVQVWHIYALMLLRGVAGSFQMPALLASTSLMVPKDHLTRIAGLNQTLNGLLSLAAPPLGALLLAVLPFYAIMLVDVATAALAVVPLVFVFVPQPKPGEAEQVAGSVWTDLRLGLAYVLGWRGLLLIILLAALINFALTPANAILPLLVSDYFQGGAAQLSLLEVATGVGILAGGLLLSLWGGFRRRITTILVGLVILGLGLAGLGLTPADLFGLAVASLFIVGIAVPLINGPLMAILQATVAADKQGRIFTLTGSLVAISTPLGLVLAGPVSDLLGLQVWYLLAGSAAIVAGLGLAFVPAVIHIEDGPPAHKLGFSDKPGL